MVNPLIALQGAPADFADQYSKGRAAGQAFQLNAFNMDNVREDRQIASQDRQKKDIADSQAMVGNVLMAIKRQPPEMQAQALERGKQIIGSRFPGVDLSTFTLDSIDSDLATLTDYNTRLDVEKKEALAPFTVPMAQAELTGKLLTNEGTGLTNDGTRRTNAYWDNGGVFGGGSVAPSTPSAAGGDYYSKLGERESGGNVNARAPVGTATGTYQFIDGTWEGVVNSPAGRAAGLTMDGRTNPQQQEAAVRIFTADNAARLEQANIPVTEKTARLAHFLGPDGAIALLRASPTEAAANINPAAARSNRGIFYRPDGAPRTVEEVYGVVTRGFSDAPLSAGGQPQPQGQTQAAPAPSATPPAGGSAYDRAMADPRVRDLEKSLVRASRVGDATGAAVIQERIKAVMAEYGVGKEAGKTPEQIYAEERARAQAKVDVERSGGTEGYEPPPGPWSTIADPTKFMTDPAARDRFYNTQAASFTKRAEVNSEEIAKTAEAARMADEFLAANANLSTGGTFRWLPGAQGLYTGFDNDAARMDTINAALTPGMREPGSGATSDFDAQMFKKSTLGLENPREVNTAIAEGIKGKAQNVRDRALFEEWYYNNAGHLMGAEQAWQSYLNENPLFDPSSPGTPRLNKKRQDWKTFFDNRHSGAPRGGAESSAAGPAGRSAGPQVGDVVDGYRYRGGDLNSQSSWEPVQ